MNNAVLKQFRSMASELSHRPKEDIEIELKSGTVLRAKYDPLFDSVIIGGSSFPAKELDHVLKLCWGSTAVKIVKRLKSPVSSQAEN